MNNLCDVKKVPNAEKSKKQTGRKTAEKQPFFH